MYTSIIDYFERTTQKYPDKTAVIDGDHFISFVELSAQAKRIANEIIANVGLCQLPFI